MDWANVADGTAPTGWIVAGLNNEVGDERLCGNGWNGFASGTNQGRLLAKMKGQGRATVKCRDCWSEGFVGLYVNGNRVDATTENTGELRTYR